MASKSTLTSRDGLHSHQVSVVSRDVTTRRSVTSFWSVRPPSTLETRLHPSVGVVPKDEWDALFPGDVESHDLYRAFEAAPPPGFSLAAITVHDQGRLVAAAPLFRTSYRLDTPFQGAARRLSDRVYARHPRLLSLPVLGIGSPMSDNCNLGLAATLSADERRAALAALLDGFMKAGCAEKTAILAVKSLAEDPWQEADLFEERGFGCVTSVPVVTLPLPYVSLNHYLASLPEKDGSYLKRKLRSAAKIRIEYRTSVEGLEARISDLYEATLKQSAVNYGEFDRLHPAYFSSVLNGLGDRAQLMLCWRGDELLSFQVFLVGANRIIANKIGMKYPEARELNLYFVNWLKMIEFAIERGIPEIEMGATTYAAKLLFGGYMGRRWLYFRFRGGLVNVLTRPLHGLFDFERNDPELQKLASRTG